MDPDAEKIVDQAWEILPPAHHELLVEIRADQRAVHCGPLGSYANMLLTSAGCATLAEADELSRNEALGLWLPDLRLILINVCHGLSWAFDATSRVAALAHVAWHEWGHALGLTRAGEADVADGPVSWSCFSPRWPKTSARPGTVVANTRTRSSLTCMPY